MPDDLDDMIKRTRRVMRVGADEHPEAPAVPPGFTDRLARARNDLPKGSTELILWQRLSFAGVAVACAVTIASALTLREGAEMQVAADPWLDMPMSSANADIDEPGGSNQ